MSDDFNLIHLRPGDALVITAPNLEADELADALVSIREALPEFPVIAIHGVGGVGSLSRETLMELLSEA